MKERASDDLEIGIKERDIGVWHSNKRNVDEVLRHHVSVGVDENDLAVVSFLNEIASLVAISTNLLKPVDDSSLYIVEMNGSHQTLSMVENKAIICVDEVNISHFVVELHLNEGTPLYFPHILKVDSIEIKSAFVPVHQHNDLGA